MQYRILGRTGLSVSEIGYGAWGIGGDAWVGAQESDSLSALHRAIELGVNFIDTARAYGESERIVGRAVREHPRDQLYVATKVPPHNGIWPAPTGLHPDEAFSGAHIRTSVETSLAATGLDTIDILQFHVWSDEWVGGQPLTEGGSAGVATRGDWLETVASLKQAGKIRFFGISVNDYQPENVIEAVRTGAVDTVQVIYNVFHQRPLERLFPACAEQNVGVIVRVALDEGGLTGAIRAGSTFPAGDFRNTYFGGGRAALVEQHVDALIADLGIEPEQLAETALRFALAPPEVGTVIAGMRSLRNVERNAAISDGKPLDQQLLAALAKHSWERDFYRSG